MKKSLIKDGVFWIIAANSLEFFGWGFIDPLFSIFANGILDNFFYIGLLLAIKNFTALLVTIPISQCVHKITPRNLAIFARILTIVFTVGYFLAGLNQSILTLFIAQVLSGIAQPLRDVAGQDFLIENIDKKRASSIMGLDFFTKNAFWIISCSLSGFALFFIGSLLNQNNIEDLIFYNFIFLAIASFFGIFVLLKIETKKKRRFFWFIKHAERIVLSHKTYLNFFRGFKKFSLQLNFSLVLFFLLSMLERVIGVFVPLLAFQLNLPLWQIGLLLASFWLPYLFTFFFSILADKFDRLLIIICGLLLSLIPLTILSFTEAPLWLGICSSLITLSIALMQPANLGIVASLAPNSEKAHIAGMGFIFSKMGIIFGAILLGFIAEKFGLRTIFVVIALLALIFTIMAIFVKFKSYQNNTCKKHNKIFRKVTHHHIFHHAHILR